MLIVLYFILLATGSTSWSAQNNAHTSMCFSHSREFLARGLANKLCVVSNTRYTTDPTYLNHTPAPAAIETLDFSPDDNLLASGDSTGIVRVWNHFSTQKLRSSRKPYGIFSKSAIKRVRFVDNTLLALAKNKPGKTLALIDCITGKTISRCNTFANPVIGLETSATPNIIVFADQQRTYVWDIRTNTQMPGRTNKYTLIESIACHPTEPLIAIGYSPTCRGLEKIKIWNYAEAKLQSFHNHISKSGDAIQHINFDPNKEELLFFEDKKVIVVNHAVGKEKYRSRRTFTIPILALAYNNETIVLGMQNGETACLMNRYKSQQHQ